MYVYLVSQWCLCSTVTTNRIGNRIGLVPTICWSNGHKHTHKNTQTQTVLRCTRMHRPPPNHKFDWILPLERLADHTHLSIPRRWIFRQFLTIPTIWNDYDHITINHVHFFGSATAQRVRYRQHDYSLYEYNCCLSHRGFCHWFCWSLSLPTGMLPLNSLFPSIYDVETVVLLLLLFIVFSRMGFLTLWPRAVSLR